MSRETSFAGGSQAPEISRCQQMVSQAITEANLPQEYCPIINRQIGVIMSRPNTPAGCPAGSPYGSPAGSSRIGNSSLAGQLFGSLNSPRGSEVEQSAEGRLQGFENFDASYVQGVPQRADSAAGNFGQADFGYWGGSPVLRGRGQPPSPVSVGSGVLGRPQFHSSMPSPKRMPPHPRDRWNLEYGIMNVISDDAQGGSGTGGDVSEGWPQVADDWWSIYGGERFLKPQMNMAGRPKLDTPPYSPASLDSTISAALDLYTRRPAAHNVHLPPGGSPGAPDSEYSASPLDETSRSSYGYSMEWGLPPAEMTPDRWASAGGRLEGRDNFEAFNISTPWGSTESAPGAFFNDTSLFPPSGSPIAHPLMNASGGSAAPSGSPPTSPAPIVQQPQRGPAMGCFPGRARRVIPVPPRDQWPQGYNTSDSSGASPPTPVQKRGGVLQDVLKTE